MLNHCSLPYHMRDNLTNKRINELSGVGLLTAEILSKSSARESPAELVQALAAALVAGEAENEGGHLTLQFTLIPDMDFLQCRGGRGTRAVVTQFCESLRLMSVLDCGKNVQHCIINNS